MRIRPARYDSCIVAKWHYVSPASLRPPSTPCLTIVPPSARPRRLRSRAGGRPFDRHACRGIVACDARQGAKRGASYTDTPQAQGPTSTPPAAEGAGTALSRDSQTAFGSSTRRSRRRRRSASRRARVLVFPKSARPALSSGPVRRRHALQGRQAGRYYSTTGLSVRIAGGAQHFGYALSS
jgi:hypothetical protein